MSALDMLVQAEVSSDLRHYDHDCDVDLLGAAGMSAAHYPIVACLYRLKYLNDMSELPIAKDVFGRWARVFMLRRKLDPSPCKRVGVQALTHWVNDVCPVCAGRGMMTIPGTPALSDRECQACGGTGKRRIEQPRVLAEVWRDLHGKADATISAHERYLRIKMGTTKYFHFPLDMV